MTYSKGLHILAEIDTDAVHKLGDFMQTKQLLQELIEKHELCVVGEVFHNFEGGGFTGVFCLSESHVSIHTWPEFGRVTYDVFLSNFKKNNEHIVRDFNQQLMAFFEPTTVNLNELFR
jgi:S-adenosylmethionine decarboxylase